MQKVETSTLDVPAIAEEKKAVETKNITKLIDIAIDDKGMVYVNWPVDKKETSLIALCEALKLISTYQPKIIIPPKPSILDFVRGRKP